MGFGVDDGFLEDLLDFVVGGAHIFVLNDFNYRIVLEIVYKIY